MTVLNAFNDYSSFPVDFLEFSKYTIMLSASKSVFCIIHSRMRKQKPYHLFYLFTLCIADLKRLKKNTNS